MSGVIDLHLDILDRTKELMQSRLETIGDISFHTGLEVAWLTAFANRTLDQCRSMDVSNVCRLHDWLILLELACPIQRYGCDYAMQVIGDAACYLEKARLLDMISGLLPLGECWEVWGRAQARVDGLRTTNTWITLPSDQRAMLELEAYLAETSAVG